AAAGEGPAVAADQAVSGPEVLTQAEIDVAGAVEREAREAVVGVVTRRVEPDDRRGDRASGGAGGPAVAVAVLQAVNRAAGRDEDRAVARDGQVHRHAGPLEETAHAFRLAVAIAILEQADPVGRRTFVAPGPEVGMTLDDQDPAARVDRDPGGRDD